MVSFPVWLVTILGQAAAAKDQHDSLLSRLAPPDRARVMLALLALVVLGLALIGLVVVTGRYARRMVGKPLEPTQRKDDDWYRKPIAQHPLEPRDPPPADPTSQE